MKVTRKLTGEAFEILSGDDDLTFTMMTDPKIEASGVISVISNIAPAAVAAMTDACLRRDDAEAQRLRDALAPLFAIVTVSVEQQRRMPDGSVRTVKDKFRNPAAVKAAMNGLGMPAGLMRAPMGRLTLKAVEIVRQAVRTVWQNNPELLSPVAEAYGVDIEARLAPMMQRGRE